MSTMLSARPHRGSNKAASRTESARLFLAFIASINFIARHRGEGQRAVLARVRERLSPDRAVSQLKNLRQDVRIQEGWGHELFEVPREIRPLANGLVEAIDFFVAQAFVDVPPIGYLVA